MSQQQLLITIIGTTITFAMTVIGASLVFFIRSEESPRINTLVLGFSSGVMIAASVWSLLIPSLEEGALLWGKLSWIPAATGFIAGGLFMVIADKLIPSREELPQLHKPSKLFVAVLVHNIPEGLAVGFAFGSAITSADNAAFFTALGLAVGIAIQNLPEGAAVSLPMRSVTGKPLKAFGYGVISGAVEPVFALLGILLATSIASIQPWLLAFSAGAMIFVVAEDLIPDSKLESNPKLGAWGVMLGFAIMMILDVTLG